MTEPKPESTGRTLGIRVSKDLTAARLGIGRAGGSLTTREILDFDLAHARARDAVHQPWDLDRFEKDLRGSEDAAFPDLPVLRLRSAAPDRATYLKRPDLGRRLSREAIATVGELPKGPDLAIIVSDGLSAYAAAHQAPLVLRRLVPEVLRRGWTTAPILAVPLGRVGLSDHVGEILQPRASLILLGERPGLATPESLGAYFTYAPRLGRTDADRNCLSNIHADGMKPAEAAEAIVALIEAAFRHALGGVPLSVKVSEASERAGLSDD